MRRFLAPPLLALGLVAGLAACPGAADPGDSGEGELVVGVQAEELGALVGDVAIVAKVDGAVVAQETLPAGRGLPKEVSVKGAAGARVDVSVEAKNAQVQGIAPPLVTRTAVARIPRSGKHLLRLQLQPVCADIPPALGSGDARTAIHCDAPLTCIAGRCVAPEVPDAALEAYAPDWPKNPPDICKPANAGPPEVVLGTGMTDYASLADGQVLALERGPQGGHHIWIAVRMKNLRQSGSMTTIHAKVPDDPSLIVPDAAYVFTYDRDEGNYCKLWGLRFQLDSGASNLNDAYKPFLGKRLEVTVDVVDSAGTRASATRTIQIAPQLLCPDGTTSCNTSP